jgi:3-hydroxymyristoyl/3-hydroxydecanoyl-(acyl carrier protein) dehydratase
VNVPLFLGASSAYIPVPVTLDGRGESAHIHFEPAGTPHTFRATLSPDLLYFQGHFDGLPLLPAVAQLSRIVLPLIRREHPDLGSVHKLRRARFRHPIGPNATITVTLSRAELRVSFEITLAREVAASGTLEFHPRASAVD